MCYLKDPDTTFVVSLGSHSTLEHAHAALCEEHAVHVRRLVELVYDAGGSLHIYEPSGNFAYAKLEAQRSSKQFSAVLPAAHPKACARP